MADPIRPLPAMLGTGGAANAARAVSRGGALNRVDRAEAQALGLGPTTPAPVVAPAAAAPTTPAVGAAPSEDLMARLKAQQAARNEEVIRRAMAARGVAAGPAGLGAVRPASR